MKSSSSSEKRISVSDIRYFGNERQYVDEAVRSQLLTWHSPFIERFETAVATLLGVPFALSCASGTAALHLALLAAGLTKNKDFDVFVPALTYVATANAVRYCGARVVPVDVDRLTWTMSPKALEAAARASEKAGRRPFGVIPVHLYGVPADMESIVEIANHYGMVVIEDAAESIGSSVGDWQTGTIGDVGCFSFFANKTLTCGEGGIVVCREEEIAKSVALYRGQGMSQRRRYFHPVVGYNYRMTAMQAAIGLGQIETADEHFSRRREIAKWYSDAFQDSRAAATIHRQVSPNYASVVPWLLGVSVLDRDSVAQRMQAAGVETRPMFVPLTQMPPYSGETPAVARWLGESALCLPLHANLSEEDVYFVVETLIRSL